MTPVFRLCEEYVRRLAVLDPVTAGMHAARDRQAAAFLRERLSAEAAWYEIGEPFRLLRAQFGLTSRRPSSSDALVRVRLRGGGCRSGRGG